jgi:hypothetical protein
MYSTRNEGRSVGNTASFSVCDMSGLRDLQTCSKDAIVHHIRGHDPFSQPVIQTLLGQSGREVGDINDRPIAYSWAGYPELGISKIRFALASAMVAVDALRKQARDAQFVASRKMLHISVIQVEALMWGLELGDVRIAWDGQHSPEYLGSTHLVQRRRSALPTTHCDHRFNGSTCGALTDCGNSIWITPKMADILLCLF